jgi:hypothetical protein
MDVVLVSVKRWLGLPSCALFQDAAGTLPVYLPGQGQVDPPVGLQLDKRLGLVRGAEVVVNGSFEDGRTGWTVTGEDATHIATFSGGQFRYQSDTTTPVLNVTQSGVLTIGRWYYVEVDIATRVSGSMYLVGLTGSGPGTSVVFNPGITRFVAMANNTAVSLARNTANVDITFNGVSIRELPGNHAYQTTTASRPTLSARYNWAVATEDLTSSAWQKGTPAFTINPKSTLAPDGASLADVIVSPDTGTPIFSQVMTAQAPTVSLSFFIKPIANAPALSLLFRNNTTATNYDGTTLNTVSGSAGVPAWVVAPAGNGWLKISYTRTSGVSSGDQISIYAGATGAAATPGRSWSVWGLDVRAVGDGAGLPQYQRVFDASTYDSVGFPLYLRFDGVDDFLQTGAVDLSAADKLLLSAAIRRLSDSGLGVVLEASADYSASNGTFVLLAPGASGTPSVGFNAKGTALTGGLSYTTSAAPVGLSVSAYADIATSVRLLRVNGAQVASSTTSIGTGSFGNAPLFIGRRNGASLPFNGRLYGLLLRGAASNDGTFARVERYLNQKGRVA